MYNRKNKYLYIPKSMYWLIAIFILLISIIIYLVLHPVTIRVPTTETNTNVVVERGENPEFRRPPLKRYKPGFFHQMGLLLGPSNETLPLYGRACRGYRDRYHYYTATPGQQIYSLPVTYNNQDCTEDIGCPELYGNESVTVTGQTGPFTTNIYRTQQFMDYY